MLNWEERRQLVKIANLYYNDNWTQEKIAKKLSVSRPIISKALQKAKDMGIIEVFINDETVLTIDLENVLEKRYQLHEAVVVPVSYDDPTVIRESVAKSAASYISKSIKDDRKLGVSWGETLTSVVNQYPFEKREDMKIIPLEGGMGRRKVEIHANQLAYELAKKMGGTCSYLYAPAVVESKELKDRLMMMEDIRDVIEEGKQVDIALIGLGNPFATSTLEKAGYLQKEDIDRLKSLNVVGDIGFRFFDGKGNPVEDVLNKETIGITLTELKKIKKVIAVACGPQKMESIKAALQGEFIDVLITDEETAKLLAQP